MSLRSIWQEDMLIDIMGIILKKVSIGDYVRMTAVCKSWRSMLAADHHKPSHDLEAPWLLQLKDCAYNHDTGFNFYSLSEGRFYTFKLPTHILNKYPKVLARGTTFCCATSNGWLVIVAGPYHNPDMFLFDPISEIDIKLPSLTTIPFSSTYFDKHIMIALMVHKVHVLSISDDPTRNLIVVVVHFLALPIIGDILAFCNCGNEVTEEERSWVIFDADGAITYNNIESMLFHNGVLYTLISNKDYEFDPPMSSQVDERIGEEIDHVVVLKTDCCEVKMKIINIVKHNTASHTRPCDNELRFIANSGLKYVSLTKSITGELLIIWNNTDPLSEDDDDDLAIYHTSKLTIERYKGIYRTSKDFESITSLDDQALFVSPNSNSFSIPARSDGNGCQANCIYFTVDALDALYKKSLALYRQSGIYCMQEGRIKRPFPNPPLWFQPRLRN